MRAFVADTRNKAKGEKTDFPVDTAVADCYDSIVKRRVPRVWKSEEQILQSINHRLEQIAYIQQDLICLDDKIRKQLKKLSRANPNGGTHGEAVDRLRFLMSEKEIMEKRAQRYRSALPGLKEALAAMRTQTFEFMGDYRGVTLTPKSR